MKLRKLLTGIVLIAIGVWIIWYGISLGDEETSQDAVQNIEQTTVNDGDTAMQTREEPTNVEATAADGIVCEVFDQSGELGDVADGQASGIARTCVDDAGTFYLTADISSVPELESDYFYEGWLVNRSTGSFISTGEARVDQKSLDDDNGLIGLRNEFFSYEKDYTEYNYYVLTLEPDDGDPAPAKHIVEGELR